MIIIDDVFIYLRNILLAGLLLGCCCFPLLARELNQDTVLVLRKQGTVKPLAELLKMIASKYPHFSLVETYLKEQQGQYFYKVNIITKQGIARTIIIDASTSTMIEDKVDN